MQQASVYGKRVFARKSRGRECYKKERYSEKRWSYGEHNEWEMEVEGLYQVLNDEGTMGGAT